jgi:CheY-like chemotaxis protein
MAVKWFHNSLTFKAALENTVDLPVGILLDIKLDGESGFEVLDWLRAQPRYQTIPAFLISSGRIPREILAAMHSSASAYFFKPFKLEGYQDIAAALADILPLPKASIGFIEATLSAPVLSRAFPEQIPH